MENSNKSADKINSLIDAFDHLGQQLNNYANQKAVNPKASAILDEATSAAQVQNPWFTKDNIYTAFLNWAALLKRDVLTNWISGYQQVKWTDDIVGLVLAGNLPLVGLHDLICVLMSGHKAVVKLASKDKVLIPALVRILQHSFNEINDRVQFVNDSLGQVDKVIATGSNNSSRYFSYYFKNIPHIIRKNRNSVAVLTGKETEDQLAGLADDICLYFGLGCRSVSKIWVPEGYDFDFLFRALFRHKDMIHHNGYANNYDYNKAIFLMNQEAILDNGFVILKEDERISSPIACLYYSYFKDRSDVDRLISTNYEDIQCIVSTTGNDYVLPGRAQCPQLNDYADNVDTMEVLLKS
ncbi:acyl-CoA reductase [Flavobacteriaceae bacterium]|nr:acyl-CoA reductase [Flavobacteriaceae bacterium]